MIKNIKYFIYSLKLLCCVIILFCILIFNNGGNANDFFSVDNINIDIISEDIKLARYDATQMAILLGLDKLLSWKLNTKDYFLIKSIIKDNKEIDIKNIVTGYKIHYEILSNINYKAEFSVFYNLKKISTLLNNYNISFQGNIDAKIMSLNASFNNFSNWRLLINNLNNIEEITEYNILSLSYNNALIQVSINIENEASLFKVFSKSRIDIQKRLNVHDVYNISLIDINKREIDSLGLKYKNYKKDSSILLAE
jgi:hypothetical protein